MINSDDEDEEFRKAVLLSVEAKTQHDMRQELLISASVSSSSTTIASSSLPTPVTLRTSVSSTSSVPTTSQLQIRRWQGCILHVILLKE